MSSSDDEINNIPKKRGRPRKLNDSDGKKNDAKKGGKKEERDIILFMPIQLNKNKQLFTKKPDNVQIDSKKSEQQNCDSDNNFDNSSDNSSETESIDNFDSDIENISYSDISEFSDNKYKEMYEKECDVGRKKELMIKKLQTEIDKIKLQKGNSVFEIRDHRELIKRYVDFNFIDKNTNNIIDVKKTEIHCWWCAHQFDVLPCFIPERYYKDKYYVFGCFCSANCASSYNLNMNDYKTNERHSLIKRIYCQLSQNDLTLAPPKEVLKRFGGIVEIDDYRRNFITCKKEYRMTLPPMLAITHVIEEITVTTNETKNIGFSNKKMPIARNNLFGKFGIKV